MNYKLARLLTAAALSLLALTGCSTQPAPRESIKPTDHASAMQALAQCMNGRGWQVTASADSIASGSIPTDQQDRYAADLEDCNAGIFPDRTKYTDDQWTAAYELANKTADCLEGQGETIAERPSLQTFVDGQGQWNPYMDLYDAGQLNPSKLAKLEKKCPEPQYWPN
jgi:hypothetical protein